MKKSDNLIMALFFGIFVITIFFMVLAKSEPAPSYAIREQSIQEPQKSNSLSGEDDGWVWMRASYTDRLALSNAMAQKAADAGVKVSGSYLEGCITGFYDEAKWGGESTNTKLMAYKISFVASLCAVS